MWKKSVQDQEDFKPMALSKSTMVGQPEFLLQERLQDPGRQRSLTADRALLRLAAMLLLVGELLFVVIGLFHPDRESANNHPATFAEYANSAQWTAIHLGQ